MPSYAFCCFAISGSAVVGTILPFNGWPATNGPSKSTPNQRPNSFESLMARHTRSIGAWSKTCFSMRSVSMGHLAWVSRSDRRSKCPFRNVPIRSLHLLPKQRGHPLLQLLSQRAVFPHFVGDLFCLREVLHEYLLLLGREIRVEHVEARFVVEVKRARVEVCRASRHEATVHHHHLAVEHGRLVLVDPHTGFQQLAPARAGGAAHQWRVDFLSGNDDVDADATLAGRKQRAD